MQTLIAAAIAVLALLLAAGFYLVLSGTGKSPRQNLPDPVRTYNFARPSELDDDPEGDMARAEAETQYVTPHPMYAETEEEFGKLEIHLKTACSMSSPRCMRLIAGTFILGYRSYGFMEELLKAMPENESRNVLDAMEMARNPQLYMDNHPECESRCNNGNCPYSKKK